MEKIKQALEQARSQQTGTRPQSPRRDNANHAVQARDIKYTQSKKLNPDPSILRANRILDGNENDASTRAVKMLRTQVLQRMNANGWNALAITSPGSGEGKTLTSINLAISLAREVDYTVLLVDLDLHQPKIHKYFGYEPERSLQDYLSGASELPDILVNPGFEHLLILPARETPLNSSELLSSPQMINLVQELKSRYPSRFILFDLPPLLTVDDALSFAPFADAVLLVIEEGATSKDDLTHAAALLRNTPMLGTVLNKSNSAVAEAY